MTLAEKLRANMHKKMVKITGKIEANNKKKIEEICKYYGINVEEYVGALIEKSEFIKVYNNILKEQKSKEKEIIDVVNSDKGERNEY